MTETICRMYPRPDIATAAADAVKRSGLQASLVHVVAPEDVSTLPIDDVVKAVTTCGVSRAKAQIYAQGLSRGEALVVVHAPFTAAEAASLELAKFQPIPSGVPDAEPTRLPEWDESAPFSFALRLPTKSSDPTPFSRFWNLPLLRESRAGDPENLEIISLFSKKANLFSGVFAAPMLSKVATPLSNFFGLAASSKSATPLSDWLHIPTLIRKGD